MQNRILTLVTHLVGVLFLSISTVFGAELLWVQCDPKPGPGGGKHIVFLAGDEEYRSEEALPMLAQLLSQRHGFRCTVLFSVDEDGTINPDKQESLSHPEALDSADAIVMALRFRKWPDAVMKHFVDAYLRGVPIVALRTSTHAFQMPGSSAYKEFSGFGKRVLGEQWVNHWGRHKVEATRGIIEPSAQGDPILRGVSDLFGDTDVYEAYPPGDAKILVRGQVLKGMKPSDGPASYRKKRATDKQEQDVNDPMMPAAWTREFKNEAGKVNRIFCTTLGSATDLQNEGLRRLVVNAVYAGLGMAVPASADVRYVTEFKPAMYGFGGYQKGVRPSQFKLEGSSAGGSNGARLNLSAGDHIAILGNALADRMQHSGYFETLVHAAFPEYNLTVRNLSAAGDEVDTWFRSENFGTRDEWLSKVQADVIFAFYGFNESVKGPEGVAEFKADLERFLKETKSKNYSGKGSPRIVLMSPVAKEKHRDPNYPEPGPYNRDIAGYTEAMAEVAQAHGVVFVDLFGPSQKLYQSAAERGESLTVNGHYLTQEGDRLLAPALFEGLFGAAPPAGNLEKLRAAVNEKNWEWHQRYRTIDGYNVYGGRSALAYQEGKPGFISDRQAPEPHISNYRVMQQEMSQRDVLTANRDKGVWAVAQGREDRVDDSNLPPALIVPSNKPGPQPGGAHVFLSGEEAIAKMKVHSGMQVNLFADEEMFPELINPVQMAWDTKGRLWVAAWLNYPERMPTSPKGDSLLVFEDTDGDGKADKMTTFIEDLNAPTGFQFYKDGVLLMQAPNLWFVRDTDGDGRADWKEEVLMGMDSADSHHTANAICLDPGGAIYLSDGVFHRTQVESVAGPVRNTDAAIYRFEPRTGRFERYIAYGFANPHGRVFDRWGNDLVTDATGNNTYFGPAFSGWLDFDKGKHPGIKQFWDRPSRPCPGTGMLTSRHFPEEFQGNFLNINVISFQGIYRVKVTEDDSGLKGETLEHLIYSDDPNFRPTAVSVGPDGAIYFVDWHNPIIGHMQHHLRDPSRDHQHGRIYRITYKGRPLLQPVKIDGAPIPALLELLKEPEDQTRELAKVELGERDTAKVIAAVKAWTKALDPKSPEYEHHMMEALWVHQWHNVVDLALLERMLSSPEPRARAAAGRVLCYWRDRVPDSLALFAKLAIDPHPRVRLEAVRGASFYRTAEAAEVALAAVKHPMDYYLDYTLKETLRQLEPYWRKAIRDGAPLAADNPAGIERLIGSVSTAELEKLPRTAGVLAALLVRPESTDQTRMLVLDDLAKARKASRVAELLGVVARTEGRDRVLAGNLARLLPALPPAELNTFRGRLEELTRESGSAGVRQGAWAARALSDGSFDAVWGAATQSGGLVDLLGGIPLIADSEFRNLAFEKVQPILRDIPKPGAGAKSEATLGRFVRVELPERGTLTLAEVQVFEGGKNIALQGKARQSTTAHGGEASRAIDGKIDGAYESGTQTHTQENGRNPWWEVDLGSERRIESITVWNRSEGNGAYAKRLDGFTITVLDGNRREGFKRSAVPAPVERVDIAVGPADPGAALLQAAIQAAVAMPRDQGETFAALAQLIGAGKNVVAAAQGIRALPRPVWPKEVAGQTAVALVAWAKKIPAGDRTAQDYVETVQLAGDLAGMLPQEQAALLRRDLRELRVAVFVVRAVREQMRFDTPRIVVEAGKPFEIIVENPDFMPHNFVVTAPGERLKMGPVIDSMKPDELDSEGRPFLPKGFNVKAATKLLEAGQRATLKMTAPDSEAELDYVCTFPGHWQVMWGQLIITKDVDAYLAKHPQAPLPAPAAQDHGHFE